MKNLTLLIFSFYILYVIFSPFLSFKPLATNHSIIITALLFIIYSLFCYWAFTTVYYAKKKCGQSTAFKWCVAFLISSFVNLSAIILLEILNYFQQNIDQRYITTLEVFFIFSFFGALVSASIALVAAEKIAFGKEGSVFGTFLAFLHLPIGVLFLHKRLKRLDAYKL